MAWIAWMAWIARMAWIAYLASRKTPFQVADGEERSEEGYHRRKRNTQLGTREIQRKYSREGSNEERNIIVQKEEKRRNMKIIPFFHFSPFFSFFSLPSGASPPHLVLSTQDPWGPPG
jgi:hypothetical protein